MNNFKIGDYVVIDNLRSNEFNKNKDYLIGKIGHFGKIVKIYKYSGYYFYVLYPYCIGESWLNHNLRYATTEEIALQKSIPLEDRFENKLSNILGKIKKIKDEKSKNR